MPEGCRLSAGAPEREGQERVKKDWLRPHSNNDAAYLHAKEEKTGPSLRSRTSYEVVLFFLDGREYQWRTSCWINGTNFDCASNFAYGGLHSVCSLGYGSSHSVAGDAHCLTGQGSSQGLVPSPIPGILWCSPMQRRLLTKWRTRLISLIAMAEE